MEIAGCPVGRELGQFFLKGQLDGSCMIVVATDAPLCARNLKRLSRRAILGLARTGGICSNGSGDYVIAFSTAKNLRIPYQAEHGLAKSEVLRNERMSPLFLAVIEASEEAILNSIFKATTTTGREERFMEAIPIDKVEEILRKYNRIR